MRLYLIAVLAFLAGVFGSWFIRSLCALKRLPNHERDVNEMPNGIILPVPDDPRWEQFDHDGRTGFKLGAVWLVEGYHSGVRDKFLSVFCDRVWVDCPESDRAAYTKAVAVAYIKRVAFHTIETAE